MQIPTNQIIEGDCLEVMRGWPDRSIHCCITSPPYWGLRDYGVEGQLGLEKTPEEYVSKMVEVFRDVRRVLRDDGTLWLNLGDSYWNGGAEKRDGGHGFVDGGKPKLEAAKGALLQRKSTTGLKLKPKDLCGIPWRVVLALQADDWYLRQDIIWAKPNPMPESCTDRCTKAHEYLFLFAKGQRKTRIVKFSNLLSERCHFLKDFGLHPAESAMSRPPSGIHHSPLIEICVRLASSVFDFTQSQEGFRLPPLYSEVWQQCTGGGDSDFVRGLPIRHRPAVVAARFLMSETTAKQFLCEMQGLGVTLSDSQKLLVGGVTPLMSNTPSFYSDGKGTVTIHHASQICQVDFLHNQIITHSHTTCKYYYDQQAIAEPCVESNAARPRMGQGPNTQYNQKRAMMTQPENYNTVHSGQVPKPEHGFSGTKSDRPEQETKNKRSVWTVTTKSFPEAHFATFPPKLIEPCILAGTSAKGCCPECGAPWERITESTRTFQSGSGKSGNPISGKQDAVQGGGETLDIRRGPCVSTKTTGWRPTCGKECKRYSLNWKHGQAQPVPCVVFDPFMGAGTVAVVALQHSRDYVGSELSPEYIKIAERRIRAVVTGVPVKESDNGQGALWE